MQIIRSIPEMMRLSCSFRREGRTTGFVPTMGALHEGHLSLVRASVRECDATVVSIFVNPAQFGPEEDLEKYPRNLERDAALLADSGCRHVFTVKPEEMYPSGFRTWVDVEKLKNNLCGRSRPEHFRGVTTVVGKLFNIIRPDKAYFGWKDAQQVLIIKRMTEDLNLGIEISAMPTIRDSDGLAMSSRNRYLSPQERKKALLIPKAIDIAKEYFQKGGKSTKLLLDELNALFKGQEGVRVDYISLVDMEELDDAQEITGNTLLALAVKVGSSRLIDNHIFSEDEPCSDQ